MTVNVLLAIIVSLIIIFSALIMGREQYWKEHVAEIKSIFGGLDVDTEIKKALGKINDEKFELETERLIRNIEGRMTPDEVVVVYDFLLKAKDLSEVSKEAKAKDCSLLCDQVHKTYTRVLRELEHSRSQPDGKTLAEMLEPHLATFNTSYDKLKTELELIDELNDHLKLD